MRKNAACKAQTNTKIENLMNWKNVEIVEIRIYRRDLITQK